MKKKNVWVASDGKEFTDQGACIEYERSEGFRKAAIEFVKDHLGVSRLQATELVEQLQDFWTLIRDNAEAFQKVLNLAKPRKKRGRPPVKKKVTPMTMTAKDAVASPEDVIAQAGEPNLEVVCMTAVPNPELRGPNRGGDAFEHGAGLPPAVPGDLSQAEEVEEPASELPVASGRPAPWRAPS